MKISTKKSYQVQEQELHFELFFQLVKPLEQLLGEVLRIVDEVQRREVEALDGLGLLLLLVRLLDVLQQPLALPGLLVDLVRQLPDE